MFLFLIDDDKKHDNLMFLFLQHHKKIILPLLFSGFLIYVFFLFGNELDESWDILSVSFNKVSLKLCIVLLGLSLVNYFLRGVRWYLLCGQFTNNYNILQAVWDYFCGFAFTVTPAKAGELIRTHYLKERFKISYTAALIPSLFDRINDVFVLFIVTLTGSILYFFNLVTILILCAVSAIFIIFFFSPTRFIAPVKWVYYKFDKKYVRLFAKITLFCRYCHRLKSWHIRLLSFLLSFIGWGAEFYAFYILCQFFGAEMSLMEASFIFSAATIAGSLMMTPGGTGGIETAMVSMLVWINIPLSLALFLTFFIRLTTLWFSVFIGVLCLMIRSGKKIINMNKRWT